MKKESKRYKKLIESVKNKKIDTIDTIIGTLKNNANAKFLESIDLSFKINLKKIKTADSSLRSVIELPHGNGKKIKIGVLCDENKLSDAKKSGAEVIGSEDLLKKISSGKIEFDKLICTPSMMAKVGKFGKILGPKGLMPNPKTGTVTMDIAKAVAEVKAGKIEFRVEKNGIIHNNIGKVSFSKGKIVENARVFLEAILKAKPQAAKGIYMKKVTISSTMGPGIKLDQSSI